MGGVLIDSDYDLGSFCCFRRFVCVDLATGRREDWPDELLGPRYDSRSVQPATEAETAMRAGCVDRIQRRAS